MSVSVARGLFVVDLEVLFLLVLINAEEEVRPSLDLFVDITGEGFSLLL